MSQFVRFMDMHSHGYAKEQQQYIYIECDSEAEAKVIFYNRFGHNPERVSCTCCGEDYSISEPDSLDQASGYDRGCASVKIGPDEWEYQEHPTDDSWRPYVKLDDYVKQADVLVIYADSITDDEQTASRFGQKPVPSQGYVWLD